MILKTEDRELELAFKALRMEQLGDKLGGDTQFKLQEAAYDGDLKTLAMLIKQFSDDFHGKKDTDKEGVYAFIDELLDEGKTVKDIYADIFVGINDKGFFTARLETDTPPINLQQLTKDMTGKLGAEIMENMAKSQIGASLSAPFGGSPIR